VAEVATGTDVSWFAPYLPQERLLADPGVRDTMMHGIQCCVPDATLLPQRIDRLYLADRSADDAEYLVLDARERARDGDSYRYDVDVRDPGGLLVERWEGLTLRAVRKRGGAGPWVPAMLGPYLERALERALGGSRAVVVEPDSADTADTADRAGGVAARRARTRLAVSRAVDAPVELRYRPDGKPELDGYEVSASHTAGLTLAVVGSGTLSCDVETVVDRTEEDWAGLLGADLLGLRDALVGETGEPADVAGARLWTALECVRKTGAMTQALALDRIEDGWVLLSAGHARIATWMTTVKGRSAPVMFAVLHAVPQAVLQEGK
jgi:enediyne polyketide synthase